MAARARDSGSHSTRSGHLLIAKGILVPEGTRRWYQRSHNCTARNLRFQEAGWWNQGCTATRSGPNLSKTKSVCPRGVMHNWGRMLAHKSPTPGWSAMRGWTGHQREDTRAHGSKSPAQSRPGSTCFPTPSLFTSQGGGGRCKGPSGQGHAAPSTRLPDQESVPGPLLFLVGIEITGPEMSIYCS